MTKPTSHAIRLSSRGLLTLACVACATPSPALHRSSSTAVRTPDNARLHVAPPAQASEARGTCKTFGAMECDSSPALWKDPCKQLASCIEKRGDLETKVPIFVYHCDEPVHLDVSGSAVQLATLTVQADQRERFQTAADADFLPHPNGGSAAFLLGLRQDGWCLVDQLVNWDWDTMGRIENQFEARVEPQGKNIGVVILTQHASRLELDADEREEGVDDLRDASCSEKHFVLESEHYVLGRSQVSEGLCPTMPNP